MAPLCYAAKYDPFLSLDCAPTPSTLAQFKKRRGSNFAIWQPWLQGRRRRRSSQTDDDAEGGESEEALARSDTLASDKEKPEDDYLTYF